MSRRKAALELGYKSLFDYCVKRLHLSEGSVASRIHVANVSIRFPQLLVALSENRLSLTVAGLLAPHLSEDNVDKLLSDCAGMTKNAVLEYLVTLEPKPVFEPSIRKRPEPKRPQVETTPVHDVTTTKPPRSSSSPPRGTHQGRRSPSGGSETARDAGRRTVGSARSFVAIALHDRRQRPRPDNTVDKTRG